MKKLLLPSLVLLSLIGCASAPLPENNYEKAAMQLVGSHKCGATGLMPVEMAAAGKRITQNYLRSHSFNQDRLEIFLNSANQTLTVTPEICNQLAMEIVRINGGSATATPAYQPRTTNCSTYFGQTHCTTF
jgi:hypothetical protein